VRGRGSDAYASAAAQAEGIYTDEDVFTRLVKLLLDTNVLIAALVARYLQRSCGTLRPPARRLFCVAALERASRGSRPEVPPARC
jgi:hypothetical protein